MPGHTSSHGGPNKPGASGFNRNPNRGGNRPTMADIAGPVTSTPSTTTTSNVNDGSHGGLDPQQISINQMMESADIVAGGGENPYSGFGGNRPTMSEALVSAAPEEEEEQETTNSIFDALFNPNLKFQYDPVADYVNRVYGRMNPVQKKRMLAKIGYTGEFDDFLGDFGQELYDAGNLQFSDFKNPFEDIEFKAPTIPSTVGGMYDAIVGGMTLPYTQAPLAFLSGNIPGMFLSLALGKGPYTQESLESGEFANLQNAPQDYLDAVASYNAAAAIDDPSLGATLESSGMFTPDQVAQISMGEALRAEEQQATRGPADVYIPPSTSTTSGAAASGTGTDTAVPIDYQGIYNDFSADQKATADKIMAMDEYDLPYAVDYVRMGGPLF